MATLPPPEMQEMIRQFEQQEQERKGAKAARRALAQNSTVEITLIPRRQMTSREMERQAGQLGYRVEEGNGRHGKHIVAPDGSRISLPDHPGNLATGTCMAINKFLQAHRESKK